MNVFAVSTDGRVWKVEWHGHWNHPEPIRARAFPPATILATLSRRLDDDDWIDMQAFAASTDGHVWVAGCASC
ncbi:hypothetical protein ACTMTF_45235 [Nonomuraea sp. ZG12]|uniref:hypothetical protein n=1 Tax=Nonomuraea sp. ZG12 TaxID=3452207 RepID=UPI003F896EEA